ncbi:hypothetical protein [Streptomyces sp. NPDC058612]|uniref:hypothetical protein n=1 Tax=Streptomyces sp. NPDC058612 TaxID=3346555 RepID=UPI003646AADF
MAIDDPQPSRVILEQGPPKPEEGEKPLTPAQLLQWYTDHPPSLVVQLGATNLVTNVSLAALLEPMAKDIKDIHHEVVNPLMVELLQQARLESLAAAVKKSPWFEDHDQWWAYAVTAAAGILVTILAARFISKLPARLTGPPAGAAADLTPEQISNLRAELDQTNPLLKEFATQVRRLPRSKELTNQATAMGTLNTAVLGVNTTKVKGTAEAIEKLKLALTNFDPKKLPTNHSALSKTADAIGKLKLALDGLKTEDVRLAQQALLRLKIILRNLKPSDIPKSGAMRSAAGAARTLNSAVGPLATSLTGLRDRMREVGAAAQVAAGPIGA